VGWQDRRRLPLCAGGSRVRARLYALIKAIRERRRKAFRVSPFAHHRLRERPLARAARERDRSTQDGACKEPCGDLGGASAQLALNLLCIVTAVVATLSLQRAFFRAPASP
jgi:hypothetical protein